MLPSLVFIGTEGMEMQWPYFVSWSCRPMGRVTLWLGAAKVSHHPTTFGGRRHCGIVDIIVLVYHSL